MNLKKFMKQNISGLILLSISSFILGSNLTLLNKNLSGIIFTIITLCLTCYAQYKQEEVRELKKHNLNITPNNK